MSYCVALACSLLFELLILVIGKPEIDICPIQKHLIRLDSYFYIQ